MNRVKKIIGCFSVFLLLGCTHRESQKTETSFEIDDVFSPVIYYHNQYYEVSGNVPFDQLPDGYTFSGERIMGCEKDGVKLPSQNLYTTAVNCDVVQKEIYINSQNASNIIVQLNDTTYEVYKKVDGVKE